MAGDKLQMDKHHGGQELSTEQRPDSVHSTKSHHVLDSPALGNDLEEKLGHSPEDEHAAEEDDETGSQEVDTEEGLPRSRSRASSTRSRTPTIVPRSKRRGLFGRFALLPELERPYDYPNSRKWAITLVVALSGAGAPLGSAIFYPALPEMSKELNTSPTVTNLTVAFYMLSMSIFPLWWSSFSETLGRRTIYIVSFSLFVVFSILSALSTNIAMLLVMRILGGGASASVQAVGAGTIADIWEVRERGKAMGIFYLGPLCGPLLAPIIGGILSQSWGWKSTMWFLAIYGGLMLIMIFLCLPETLAQKTPAVPDGPRPTLTRMSTRQSVHVRTKKATAAFKRCFIDPLSVILYLRFPPIALTVYYAAITFGSLFVLNISTQSGFSAAPYNFPELIVGLLYIPSSLGYIVASIFGGKWIDSIMAREARKAGRYDADGKLIYLPEERMRENAWLAGIMYPVSLIWFGWTLQHGLHWIIPSIANFFFGVGSMLVFGMATTMLTEFMPKKSSSGIALNNFVRNIFSCVGAIVTQPLINVMGYGWLATMFGIVSFVSGYISIWMLVKHGPRWRKAMDEKLK